MLELLAMAFGDYARADWEKALQINPNTSAVDYRQLAKTMV
jgi:hypothetical protein